VSGAGVEVGCKVATTISTVGVGGAVGVGERVMI
jgi:hypothetical protein